MKKLLFLIIFCLPFVAYSQIFFGENCNDEIDNDGNGLTDCADPFCASSCKFRIPCSSETVLYQVSNPTNNPNTSQFTQYNVSTGTFTIINDDMGVNINAISYNVQDGLIYGFGDNDHLYQVRSNGNVTDLGTVANLPSTTGNANDSYYIGAFDDAGNLFVMSIASTSINRMYSIDVSLQAPIFQTHTLAAATNTFRISDMVFEAGIFYFMQDQSSLLYSLDPTITVNGRVPVNSTTLTGIPNCPNWGSAFSSRGLLYFFCNQSARLYSVDLDDNFTTLLVNTTGTSVTGSDGASCPLSNGLPVNETASYCCDSPNLLTNGNFENGFAGFQNFYTPVGGDGVINPNQYDVTSSITNVTDHTSCETGGNSNNSYLVINGNGVSTRTIWETTDPINVSSNTTYKFCAYIKDLAGDDLQVRTEVRHWSSWVPASSWVTINTGNDPCDWQELGASFTTKNSTVDVRMRMKGVANNASGLDVAIDDIALVEADEFASGPQITVSSSIGPNGFLAAEGELNAPNSIPSECGYFWAIVEVTSSNPFTEDWGQTLDNVWFGGTIGQSWDYSHTNFSGIDLPGDKDYRIYFYLTCDGCLPEVRLYGLAGGGAQRLQQSDMECLKEQTVEIGSEAYHHLLLLSNTKGNPSPSEIASLPKTFKKVELDCAAASKTDMNSLNTSDIKISPNPFESSFSIEFSTPEDMPLDMRVITMQGVEVYRDSDLQSMERIDLGGLASGIYLVTIKYQDRIETRKIVKDKRTRTYSK